MRSLCFAGISIIDVEKKKSYAVILNQLIFTLEEKENLKKQKDKRKKAKGGRRGRKKGTKNSPRKEKELTPTFRLLKSQLKEVLKKLAGKLSIRYFAGDGSYGNSTCANICEELSMFLVSKLQYNAALYFRYTGDYAGRGRKRIYGEKVNYNKFRKVNIL